MMRSHFRLFVAALAALVLNSCVSSYDAQAQKSLTDLKAFHLKVIDDNTDGSSVPYSSSALKEKREQGDLLFRQAETYSGSLKDGLRTRNFQLLHESFFEDVTKIAEKSKKISKPFSGQIRKETEQQYDLAIKGEKARPDAP